MTFGTPSQVSMFVYVAAYIFIVGGLIWGMSKPKNSKKTKQIRKYKKRKKK